MPNASHSTAILQHKVDEVEPWVIENVCKSCTEENGLKTVRQLCRELVQWQTPAGGQGRSQGWPLPAQQSGAATG